MFPTVAILILLVKFSTIHAVVFSLVASPALSGAIISANILFNENILDAVGSLRANPNLEEIVGNARGAVVREQASRAFVGAFVVGEHLVPCFNHHIKFSLVAKDFHDPFVD